MGKLELLRKAMELRAKRELDEAKLLFEQLSNEYPEDPEIAYQHAWNCDNMGLEEQAVPLYSKAITKGLQEPELTDCFLGLGSSYRHLKEYEKSEQTFKDALLKCPNSTVLKTFLALTWFENGKKELAFKQVVRLLVETTEDEHLASYRRALLAFGTTLT